MKRILECIPNFSEGKRPHVIEAICTAIKKVPGVYLMHVDVGISANRTVVTFAGEPEAVIEAAFQGIKRASQLIDMRKHEGTHPRMGATDVCPLVPIKGISTEETIELAQKLGERVGEELDIPVYLYEQAAQKPERTNLAFIRSGEYEGFKEKILEEEWKPDFGPQKFNEASGQTVIGVRDFLIAYNVNLNTQSIDKAKTIAAEVRESGRLERKDGQIVYGEDGLPKRVPGKCLGVKAIGWYVEEYGLAQVSTNLTCLRLTPLHEAFDAIVASAHEKGLRVTGSELVGMVPEHCLVDAGKYFLEKQGESTDVSKNTLIHIARMTLGLSEVVPFELEEKVIEYKLRSLIKA